MTTSNLYIRTKQVCVGAAGKGGGGGKVPTTLELSSKNLAAMTLLECPVKML